MRCMLIYMTISLKKYLLDVSKAPPNEATPDQVRKVVMRKVKIIKFGLHMTYGGDLHIK